MTTIKLMTDYGCNPIWGVETFGNIDPNSLPITEHLRVALAAWAKWYDETLNWDDPLNSPGFGGRVLEEAFEAEGRRLWRQLQQELGPSYQVVYFSSIDNRVHE